MPKFPVVSRKKIIKALLKFGFTVDTKKGKGSHYKVYAPTKEPQEEVVYSSVNNYTFFIVPKNTNSPKWRSELAKYIASHGIDLEAFIKEL